MTDNQFKDIRPYRDHEVKEIIEQLLQEEAFLKILSYVFPKKKLEEIIVGLKQINTIQDFQKNVVYLYLSQIINKSISRLSFSGMDRLDTDKNYLFISNHRDIILDSALLNVILFENSFNTCEIAIGSNLLLIPWIEHLVKLNKSFVVKRNLSAKEMLMASRELSAYVHHSMFDLENSLWIAQREGRTKDGNDKTNTGLLKMLNMHSDATIIKTFKTFKLVPVSISYENEPCDKAKARELYIKYSQGSYKKNPKEDIDSMNSGIINYKGRVHFNFGKPLKKKLDKLKKFENRNERFNHLSKIVDQEIYKGYKLFPNNYIAYDKLFYTENFIDKYSESEYKVFTNYVASQIEDIQGDKKIIERIFLGIYANPLINKFQPKQKPIRFI